MAAVLIMATPSPQTEPTVVRNRLIVDADCSLLTRGCALWYPAGTMEAIFWGAARWRGNTGYTEPGCILATPEGPNRTNASICDGSSPETSKNCCGPWIGADLESGMYYGGGDWGNQNEQNKPLRHDFVSLMLKGRHDGFVLKGGDAAHGALQTMYNGARPTAHTYTPMKKEGAIILGTGGDQSNGAHLPLLVETTPSSNKCDSQMTGGARGCVQVTEATSTRDTW
jgi:hypothetical protein